MSFSPIPEILQELREGKPIVLVDDEDRENEGDIVYAAEKVTPEAVNFMLKEARDRYAAGVSGSLEVVQAQEAVAAANDNEIQALYLNNVAKLSLVRALGEAEQRTRSFLGGK